MTGKRRLTPNERAAIERDWKSTNAVRDARRHVVTASKLIEELKLLHEGTGDDRFSAALIALGELRLIKADGGFRRLGPKRAVSDAIARSVLLNHMKEYEQTSACIVTARDCMIDAANLTSAAKQVERLLRE
ncbi:hypothetical protein [Enterovirga rhinocerotis]|uniref:Uncharacterized protein n=1 Tax=Enterovirga rhinocerotis TaxID=1339210 RepID=A0A4R7C6M9_9HYPH|nr:hypothetical protein [Enterovirga rhinocerotis]TDR93793.1 hypothetical protein EV668_1060 [Enterovirga rhinocerotis]